MSKLSCHIYLPPPVRHGLVRSGSLSARACLGRLRKPRAGSVGGRIVWTNLRQNGIPGSPSELRLRGVYHREVIRGGRSCQVDVVTGVDGRSAVKLIAAAANIR